MTDLDEWRREEIEHIATVDAEGNEITYVVAHYPGRKRRPYSAGWRASIGYYSDFDTIGQAQRMLLRWHARFGGPPLEFKDPQYDRRLTHPTFGEGTLIEKRGNKITVMFDAVGRKELLASFVQFHEEE